MRSDVKATCGQKVRGDENGRRKEEKAAGGRCCGHRNAPWWTHLYWTALTNVSVSFRIRSEGNEASSSCSVSASFWGFLAPPSSPSRSAHEDGEEEEEGEAPARRDAFFSVVWNLVAASPRSWVGNTCRMGKREKKREKICIYSNTSTTVNMAPQHAPNTRNKRTKQDKVVFFFGCKVVVVD